MGLHLLDQTLTSVSNLPRISTKIGLVLDTETDGLDPLKNHPHYLAIALIDRDNQYVVRWSDTLVQWLNDNLPLVNIAIFHYAKFDLHMFLQGGVKLGIMSQMKVHCTLLSEVLIDEHQKAYNLDYLGRTHLNLGKLPIGDKKNILAQTIKSIVAYAKRDVTLTKGLYLRQIPIIKAQDLEIVHALEMKVVKVLVNMERRGVPIVIKSVHGASQSINDLVMDLKSKINQMAGFDLNVASMPQLIRAFNSMGLPVPMNEFNRPSFNKKSLIGMGNQFGNIIVDLRSARKMKETFIDRIGNFYNTNTHKVHTTFNQLRDDEHGGVHTGRLSSSNPNMQQIPSPKRDHKEAARIIRSLYAPNDNLVWCSGDWAQFEFRIFAHYSNDQNLIEAYRVNPRVDFHSVVSEMTTVKRDPDAKQINLGLVFGMGEGKLAVTLGLPVTFKEYNGRKWPIPGQQAKELFAMYHSKFPGAKQILQQASRLARSRGYVKTIYGRRIRFPYGQNTHKAGGLVFQGTAADLMKKKLIELDQYFESEKNGTQLILTVHDEFDVICPREMIDSTKKIMNEIMTNVPELRIPIIADIQSGYNWWEASK